MKVIPGGLRHRIHGFHFTGIAVSYDRTGGVTGAGILTVLGAAFEAASQMIEYGHIENKAAIGVAALSGAITAVAGPVGTVAVSAISSGVAEKMKGKSLKEAACSAVISGATAGIMDGAANKLLGKVAKNTMKNVSKPKISTRVKQWIKWAFKRDGSRNRRTFLTSFQGGKIGLIYTGVSSYYQRHH